MKKLTVLALFLMFAFSLGQVAGGLAVASQDVRARRAGALGRA